MITCPKCSKELPENTDICPECGNKLNVQTVKAIPNIPRREPDPLPERPGPSYKGSSSENNTLKVFIILSLIAVIHLAVLKLMH